MQTAFFQRFTGLILLAVIVLAGLFVNLGGAPLFDEDEGAYAQVTCEMLASGDWLVPRLGGKPFFHKPPMIYWTQAVCVHFLGKNEFALRLPSALASLIWALLLYLFVRRHVGPQAAWLVPFFLVTALQTGIVAKAAIADALLNLFIAAAMLALYEHVSGGRKAYLWAAFGAMAMGFMTKGPIAVAIPACVATVYLWSNGQVRWWLKMACDPVGWGVFLLIAVPWHAALYTAFGDLFFKEYFLIHNLGRFRGAMEGHSGPFFFYIPVILIGLLPYTTLLVAAGCDAKRFWLDPLGRYLIFWFVFVLILFSLAQTKLHHYIVYGYVPLLIFMAQSVPNIRRQSWVLVPAAIFLGVTGLVPVMAFQAAPYITDEFARIVIVSALDEFGAGYYMVMGVSFCAVVVLGLWQRIGLQMKILVAGVLLAALINGYLVPKAASIMQGPVKSAALLAKEKGYDVVMWQMTYPSFGVYNGRPIQYRTPKSGDVVITKAHKLQSIDAYRIIYQKHGIVLAHVDSF
jgi:4-amino-4-deoxy-L-arabinose transferase-like glycosyltransferase